VLWIAKNMSNAATAILMRIHKLNFERTTWIAVTAASSAPPAMIAV
jgi:hypothetical protein